MADKLTHVDVRLEYPIAATEKDDPNLIALRIKRPKTRHLIDLTILLGPDLAKFLGSVDGDDAKAKLAALKDDENIAVLLAGLVTAQTLHGLLAVVADLCGITPEQAGEIDTADLLGVGKALLGFFPALKLLWPSEPQDAPQT